MATIIAVTFVLIALLTLLAIAGRIHEGTFVFRVLLALDIFVSTIIWGVSDITISSRCGMYLAQPHGPWFWRMLGRGLNRLSKNHCTEAMLFDAKRAADAINFLHPKG